MKLIPNLISNFFSGNVFWNFRIILLFEFFVIINNSGLYIIVSNYYDYAVHLLIFSSNIGLCKKNNDRIKQFFKSFNSFNFGFQTLGFILGVIYGIDAYWAFKYYRGFS